MSYTEINDHYGMNFGGINEDEIIRRLEVTDQEVINDVKGNDDFHTTQAEYTDYARGEIVDWGPDNVFLESDRPQRDPALSRSMINLHYGGTRGSNPDLPRHPEMFIGFTGNDPRGADTEPRFDNMRGWATTQALSLSARFQESNDQFVADRPWTGPSKSYAMKDLQQRIAGNTKVFTTEKVNWATGRNTTLDDVFGLRDRRFAIHDGSDGMFIPEQKQPRTFSAAVSEAFTNSRNNSTLAKTNSLKAMRNSVNDSDLEINVYKPIVAGKSGKQTNHKHPNITTDNDYGSQDINPEQKKQMLITLSTLMSMATKRHTHEDADHGDSDSQNPSRNLKLNILSGHTKKHTGEDQDRIPTILEDESPGLNKTPGRPKDIIKAGYNQTGSQTILMSDIQTIIKKMANPDKDFREIHTQIDQQVLFGNEQKNGDRGKSVGKPGDNVKQTMINTTNEVHTAAAAKGLEINVYHSSKMPKHKLPNTTNQNLFMDAMQGRIEGKSKNPQFVSHDINESHTDNPTGLDGRPVAGGNGPVGPKKLRAREHGDLTLSENVEDSISFS